MTSDLEKAEKDLEKAERDLEKAAKEVANAEKEIAAAKKREEIEVSISTTAGFYPPEGFNSVPEKQAVEHELNKAKHALNIKDVTGWIATVMSAGGGKRTLDTAKSYAENGLSERAEIDWGPSEGGGG